MKVLHRIAALAVAAAMAMPAMAQFSIGPRVGINTNELHFDQSVLNADNRVGVNAGLEAEFMIPVVNFGFDLSVMYVHRSSEFMRENNLEKLSQNYIDIPLNLKYKIGLPAVGNLISPYIFTGPSFSFLASKKNVNEFIEKKTCDIAWNFGLGVQLVKHLQIGASYGLGLTKAVDFVTSDHQNAGIEGKNRYWTVTAAWLF